jgi:hypothetical protein
MGKRKKEAEPSVRPQIYISVMLVMLMLVLAFTGQWDWVLAVLIALLLGNGLAALGGR